MKRIVDILGGLFGTLITGILCLILGPMIFWLDPGPIFFAQDRVGKHGRVFKLYKFRSMYQDAESKKPALLKQNEMSEYMFKIEHDPRILGSGVDGKKRGFGAFLRSTSLDEFPQFFNVLKGDMSLVGTRPPTLDEYEKYDMHQKERLSIKPGITGLWQVSGRNGITDFEEVVRLDMEYIKHRSAWLDFKILVKTLVVVVKRKGM